MADVGHDEATPAGTLRCSDCGAVAEAKATGWRAYLADDPGDDEPPEVATYCPARDEREFSDDYPPA